MMVVGAYVDRSIVQLVGQSRHVRYYISHIHHDRINKIIIILYAYTIIFLKKILKRVFMLCIMLYNNTTFVELAT